MTARVPTHLTMVALFLAASHTASAACEASPGATMAGPAHSPFTVAVDIAETIPVSAPFSADFIVCSREGTWPDRVSVDATMPRHQHGMNYEPQVLAGGGGSFRANGLLFHMPGLWRFEFVAYVEGEAHRFVHDVNVD